MPNSRHKEAMLSPSLSRITNRIRSSITELSFHGIPLPAPFRRKSVTHVSGTFCYLCLGTVNTSTSPLWSDRLDVGLSLDDIPNPRSSLRGDMRHRSHSATCGGLFDSRSYT